MKKIVDRLLDFVPIFHVPSPESNDRPTQALRRLIYDSSLLEALALRMSLLSVGAPPPITTINRISILGKLRCIFVAAAAAAAIPISAKTAITTLCGPILPNAYVFPSFEFGGS
ncbi:hypothetical protein CSOJ01_04005 [Colletotrichum sojae]|uniref:Uncharacterized protein n=1 Tax=Colletotrichum sojae TaxID=2175907 RepID=A0A8H6JKR3_9PEZI|nr:hypothetical protein CSOJ01_04005 [Colletotrichum sojae]